MIAKGINTKFERWSCIINLVWWFMLNVILKGLKMTCGKSSFWMHPLGCLWMRLTFEFFEILWEGEVLLFLRMFAKIHLWSHLVQCFCLLGFFFFITASISLGAICLFRFSDSSWISFGRLCVARNLSSSSCTIC